MFSRLRCERFGCFADMEFELGTTTLFVGPNESGKTTIFDALFTEICRPKRNTVDGKRLHARYGDSQVEVVSDGPAPECDQQDFLHVHAIRAGDITFDSDWNAKWRSQLKGRVLTAGVDLEAVVAGLGKLASDHAGMPHNKAIANLQASLADHRTALQQLREKRDSVLDGETKANRMQQELEELAAQVTALAGEEKTLAEQLHLEEQIVQRSSLHKDLRQLLRRRDAIERREQLARFAEDASSELQSLQQQTVDAKSKVQVTKALKEKAAEDLQQAKREVRDLETALPQAKRYAQRAQAAIELLNQARGLRRIQVRWRLPLVAAGGILVVAGVAAAALAGGLLGWALFAALAIAGVAAVVTARKPESLVDEQAQRDATAREREKWNADATDNMQAQADTLEGLVAFFDKRVRDAAAHEQDIDRARQRANEAATEVDEHETTMQRQPELVNARVERLRERLAAAGVADLPEYARMRADYLALQEQIGDPDTTPAALDSIQAELQRKITVLEQQGVPETGLDDAGRIRLDEKLSKVRGRKTQAESDERTAALDHRDLRSRMEERLGDLPDQIDKHEAELRQLQRQLDSHQQDKIAASLAAEMFEAVASDTDTQMAALSETTESYLRAALGDQATFRATDLSADAMTLRDAAGTMRDIDHLSSGTFDLVVLAARLALAEKTGELPLLLLDEPFLHLDSQREERAVRMLMEFRQRTGWQLVLLSKEPRLAEQLAEVGCDVTVHNLERRREESE